MGKYHPHGDGAIYDALVRMGQTFSLRHPLVQPKGNFGSLDDPPAASRYTECRLSPIALQMLEGIDEDTVDFNENYSGEFTEPGVLPARFPNLLVNGSQGIAVGMATTIPPPHLGEVIAAVVAWHEVPGPHEEFPRAPIAVHHDPVAGRQPAHGDGVPQVGGRDRQPPLRTGRDVQQHHRIGQGQGDPAAVR